MDVVKTKLFKKADFILFAVLVAVCVALLLPNFLKNEDKLYAYIYMNGEEIYAIDLDSVTESYELSLDCEPSLTVLVENGRICINSAECPDKLCVNCGWLKKNLDTAVCLPANVILTVKGSGQNEPDALTY